MQHLAGPAAAVIFAAMEGSCRLLQYALQLILCQWMQPIQTSIILCKGALGMPAV